MEKIPAYRVDISTTVGDYVMFVSADSREDAKRQARAFLFKGDTVSVSGPFMKDKRKVANI